MATSTSSTFPQGLQQSLASIGNILGLGATDPRLIVARLIRLSMGFLGIIFVLLIIQAGFILMVSGGKDEQVIKAKKIFYNAIIGLVLILSAYSIVQYVLGAFLPQ